jgi:hypothetical protein
MPVKRVAKSHWSESAAKHWTKWSTSKLESLGINIRDDVASYLKSLSRHTADLASREPGTYKRYVKRSEEKATLPPDFPKIMRGMGLADEESLFYASSVAMLFVRDLAELAVRLRRETEGTNDRSKTVHNRKRKVREARRETNRQIVIEEIEMPNFRKILDRLPEDSKIRTQINSELEGLLIPNTDTIDKIAQIAEDNVPAMREKALSGVLYTLRALERLPAEIELRTGEEEAREWRHSHRDDYQYKIDEIQRLYKLQREKKDSGAADEGKSRQRKKHEATVKSRSRYEEDATLVHAKRVLEDILNARKRYVNSGVNMSEHKSFVVDRKSIWAHSTVPHMTEDAIEEENKKLVLLLKELDLVEAIEKFIKRHAIYKHQDITLKKFDSEWKDEPVVGDISGLEPPDSSPLLEGSTGIAVRDLEGALEVLAALGSFAGAPGRIARSLERSQQLPPASPPPRREEDVLAEVVRFGKELEKECSDSEDPEYEGCFDNADVIPGRLSLLLEKIQRERDPAARKKAGIEFLETIEGERGNSAARAAKLLREL